MDGSRIARVHGQSGEQRQVAPALIARITVRRAQVLTYIASHHTNAQIAARLGLSESTIERHVDDLRRITGRRTKRELARWWLASRDEWGATAAAD